QNPFPIENRDVLGETQDFHSLATYLSQNTSSVFLDTISDFHLLLFLVTNEVMPLQDSISLLLEAVRTRNEELAQTWKRSEQWATIEQLCTSQVAGITDVYHHTWHCHLYAQLACSSQVSTSTAPSGAPHTRPLQPCGPVSTARS
ncbi:NPLOC4 isoform 5, partial [Pongo abelii]